MMPRSGRFEPTEVHGADTPASDRDAAAALAVARQLEAHVAPTEHVVPSAGLVDRVMAAVAREPAPRAVGFLVPLQRDRNLRGLVASIVAAWSVATAGRRPTGARAMALAYILAIVLIGGSVTGIAGFGAAGAITWLAADHGPSPSPSVLVVPSLRPSVEPEGSVEPSNEPGESADDGGGAGASNEPSDGSSGESGSSGSDGSDASATPSPSGDGSGSSGESSTQQPSGTPRPSQTPEPSQTPRPSQTPEASRTPSPTSSSGN